MLPLPTVPGKVHGIVSLDPPMVQCDGCGLVASERSLALTVILSGIRFNRGLYDSGIDKRRLCLGCADEAGWVRK